LFVYHKNFIIFALYINIIKTKRIFTIKFTKGNKDFYIKSLMKYDLGYNYHSTKHIALAISYKYKKNVDKIVDDLNAGLFQPGFDKQIKSSCLFNKLLKLNHDTNCHRFY